MRFAKNKILKHITVEQRYIIETLLKEGKTQKYIANAIGKTEGTISREIRRNCDLRSGQYSAVLAQRKCQERHNSKDKFHHWTPAIRSWVDELLEQDYSPEQIVGYSKLKNIPCVSIESIYLHVHDNTKKGGDLHTHLRCRRKKRQKRDNLYKKRSIIPGRRDIDERPKIVEERARVGDLEMDLVIGNNHKGAILTINDRATGMVKIELLETKTAEEVTAAALKSLKSWKHFMHTITTDNGREFAWHQTVSKKLNIEYFFAKPYHSWERGSNENFNGLLRQYFPKGYDFTLITEEELKKAEWMLNNRPRKRYGFLSPVEVFTHALKNNGEVNIAFMT